MKVLNVEVGVSRTNVFRRHSVQKEMEERCFSVIAVGRTLDLQTSNKEDRNEWVKYFRIIANQNQIRREKREELTHIKRETVSKQKENLYQVLASLREQIWENDIMTHFSSHWDYINHCPMRSPKNKKKRKGALCGCFSKKKAQPREKEQKLKQLSSKGFLLDTIWRMGIPPRFRKKVWPFTIKNSLEVIIQLLYNIIIIMNTDIRVTV